MKRRLSHNLAAVLCYLTIAAILTACLVCGVHGPMDADCDCPVCVLGRIVAVCGVPLALAIGVSVVVTSSEAVRQTDRPTETPVEWAVKLLC